MTDFTKEERQALIDAIRYYLYDATHDGEICGLDRTSEEYKILHGALVKISREKLELARESIKREFHKLEMEATRDSSHD